MTQMSMSETASKWATFPLLEPILVLQRTQAALERAGVISLCSGFELVLHL